MLQRRHKAPSDPFAASAHFRPPTLTASPAHPFTPEDRDVLAAWLAEAGWPRGHMDIATLEGYLVALLVWPVGVPAGAWLPPLWGGQGGWKVPAKIASLDAYTKFTGLVVGFLHELDRQVSARPLRFEPMLSRTEVPSWDRSSLSGISWAQGFLRALQQNSQGLTWRSEGARTVVTRIAHLACLPAMPVVSDADVAADLKAAISTLVAERATRGPLGALKVGD